MGGDTLSRIRERSALRSFLHEDDGATHQALATREALFASEGEAREFVGRLGTAWVGARLRYFETTDSTNTRARRLADLGWPEGTVVVAEEQTAGHGRLGRRWICPARSGLLVSVVLPQPKRVSATWLTAAGALALAEAVEAGLEGAERRPPPTVEWPNDLVAPDPLVPSGRRKIGGILVEARPPEKGLPPTAVLGAGLNVDVLVDEFPSELRTETGSLISVFGAAQARREILGRFLLGLEARIDGLAEGSSALADELRKRSFTLGRDVDLPPSVPGEDARRGRAVGFDNDMRLVVELPGGATEAVAFRSSDDQTTGQGEST